MTDLHAALTALAEQWETSTRGPEEPDMYYGRMLRALLAEHPADLPVATDSTTADHERGLYGKYRVERLSDPTGKHADCRYFVLDPEHDPIAREVLVRYASRTPDADLRRDLRAWLDAEQVAAPEPSDRAGLSETIAAALAEHDDPPGWTSDDNDMLVYECNCGDRSPALDHDYIYPSDAEDAAAWHRGHVAAHIERIVADRLAVVEQERDEAQRAEAVANAAWDREVAWKAEAEQEAATLRAQVAALQMVTDHKAVYLADERWVLVRDVRAALGDPGPVVQRIKTEGAVEALEQAADAFDQNPMPSLRVVRHRVANILRDRARVLRDGGDHD